MGSARLVALHSALDQAGLAGMALNAGPSLAYMTGLDFHLMERPVVLLVIPGKTPAIVLPQLEAPKLQQAPYPLEPFFYGDTPGDWPVTFARAMDYCALGGGKVGVEPGRMRLLEHGYLQQASPQTSFIDGSILLSGLRAKKDGDELARMRRAVCIAEEALEATLPVIRVGMTEKEVAAELVLQLFRHGSASELPFHPIVAAGPNGANPHAAPGSRQLTAGDLLVIDWGSSYEGYAADLTRTFAVGKVAREMVAIHELVQQANEAGRMAARPGARCREVDQAARQVIAAGGYGESFTHRTGHGLGLECHEEPYIHGASDRLLEVGNTFTVEPGIYLAGRNGVRIEDDLVITDQGAESLSTMTRELRRVG